MLVVVLKLRTWSHPFTTKVHQNYNNDFDMSNIGLNSFSLTQSRRMGSLDGALKGYLRAGVTGTAVYDGRFLGDSDVYCDLCENWDDDAPPTEEGEQELIDSMIRATINHDRWEDDWCNELDLGPYWVFNGAYDCTITLKNCGTRRIADDAPQAANKIHIDVPIDLHAAVEKVVEDASAKTLTMENQDQGKALL